MPEALSQDTIKELAAAGRKSLYFLAKAILGFDKMTDEIHKPICDKIQAYTKNRREVVILRTL